MAKVKCKECGQVSNKQDWEVESIDCELCGVHDVEKCPLCGYEDEYLMEKVDS